MVGAGQYGRYIGHLDVSFNDQGDIIAWGGNAVALTSSIPSDPTIEVCYNT